MAIKLETEAIRTIAAFERVTKVHARDCLMTDNCVYFLVEVKKIGLAIGKNGSVIKEMRRILGRPVRIFGYSENPEDMIKKLRKAVKISIRMRMLANCSKNLTMGDFFFFSSSMFMPCSCILFSMMLSERPLCLSVFKSLTASSRLIRCNFVTMNHLLARSMKF